MAHMENYLGANGWDDLSTVILLHPQTPQSWVVPGMGTWNRVSLWIEYCLGNFDLEDTKSKYLHVTYKAHPILPSLPNLSKLHSFSAFSLTLRNLWLYTHTHMMYYTYITNVNILCINIMCVNIHTYVYIHILIYVCVSISIYVSIAFFLWLFWIFSWNIPDVFILWPLPSHVISSPKLCVEYQLILSDSIQVMSPLWSLSSLSKVIDLFLCVSIDPC